MPQVQSLPSSGTAKRKYTDILQELVSKSFCRIECKLADSLTITAGVKKEKVSWVKAKKWPQGKALKIDIIDTPTWEGISFRMIEDTSINNL